jgi:hypothetical protein
MIRTLLVALALAALSGAVRAQNTTAMFGDLKFESGNSGATNAQAIYPAINAPFGSTAIAVNTTAVDTTADAFVNINGTLALGTETLTLLGYTVEILRQ